MWSVTKQTHANMKSIIFVKLMLQALAPKRADDLRWRLKWQWVNWRVDHLWSLFLLCGKVNLIVIWQHLFLASLCFFLWICAPLVISFFTMFWTLRYNLLLVPIKSEIYFFHEDLILMYKKATVSFQRNWCWLVQASCYTWRDLIKCYSKESLNY